MNNDWTTVLSDLTRHVTSDRRQLHMHPELSGLEHQTSAYIKSILDEAKIPYVRIHNTGVMATIEGHQTGRCIGVRADIDALPIIEQNDVPYRSVNDGVMHACGHDAHTAIQLGVARVLHQMKDQFSGTVKLVFQPDEEQRGAAKDIVLAGWLDDVDVMIGLHVMPNLDVGTIELRNGVLNAESGGVRIVVHGKASHGAYPEQGVDAIVVAGHILTQIQSIVTRMKSPLDPVVLSIGTIAGGNRPNIIADTVTMEGTLRTIRKDTRTAIQTNVEQLCHQIASSMGATVDLHWGTGYPMLENSAAINDIIVDTATNITSIQQIVWKEQPSMGAEDFGYYLDQRPGAFYHMGCRTPKQQNWFGLHTPYFDIDERCLMIGVELQAKTVLRLLEEGQDDVELAE